MASVILFILVAGFLLLFAVLGMRIVQQAETIVIERLGSYHRDLKSGINFIIPLLDKPREIDWRYAVIDIDGRTIIKKERISRIDLRETVYDFPKQAVITKDNVQIDINAVLYFQITDPVKTVYEIANLPDAIEKLTQTTLRNLIGELDLDATLSSRDQINKKLRTTLDDVTGKWGIKVNRVELQDIIPPASIRDAMEAQMRAERAKRAAVLESEGMKQSRILEAEGIKTAEITKAEGFKESQVLIAEGEAEARQKAAEGEAKAIAQIIHATKESPDQNAIQYLIAMRYLEASKTILGGEKSKLILVPYEATGILSALSGIRELLNGSKRKVEQP